MFIERLFVEKLRNLQQVQLTNFSLINVFIGKNGSGKTSLLEAIAIASQGRSFRNRNIRTVIQQQETFLKVFVECRSETDIRHRLGVERHNNNDYCIRINSADVKNLAELSLVLPTLVLDANSFDLIDGGASERRRFIDWTVFHVEPLFVSTWRRFNRLLKQRNTLLQNGVTNYQELSAWDEEYCALSIELEQFRKACLQRYQIQLNEALKLLFGEQQQIELHYKNGWQNEKLDLHTLSFDGQKLDKADLKERLHKSFDKDKKYRRSHLGPQHADIQIRYLGHEAKDVLSRGQKKIVISAMKLSQAKLVYISTNKRPILLLDDLPSELDEIYLTRLLKAIEDNQFQSFISCTDAALLVQNTTKYQMFHVEHGKISA